MPEIELTDDLVLQRDQQARKIAALKGFMAAFDFTLDDLEANINGYLTPRQLEKLQQLGSQFSCLMVLVYLFITLFTLTFSLLITDLVYLDLLDGNFTQTSTQVSLVIDVLTALAGYGVVIGLWYDYYQRYKSWQKDLQNPEIARIEGQVTRLSNSVRGSGYWVTLAGQKFSISREEQQAFKKGQQYKLYYLPHTRKIMSVRPLEAVSPTSLEEA